MYLPLSILHDLDSVRVIAINEMQKQPSSPEIGVGVGGHEQGDRSSGDELESANNTMTASISKTSLSTVPNIESITDNIEPIPDKETQVAPEIEQWNAADYLFVSTRLAKMYPEVPESKMVRNMNVVHRCDHISIID